MNRIELQRDVWTEVFTDVTTVQFNLLNYPTKTQKRTYKIHWGTSMPDVDTDEFIIQDMCSNTQKSVQLNNSTAVNIYVMPIYDNGSIVY